MNFSISWMIKGIIGKWSLASFEDGGTREYRVVINYVISGTIGNSNSR